MITQIASENTVKKMQPWEISPASHWWIFVRLSLSATPPPHVLTHSIFKQVFNSVSSHVLKIINTSLQTGIFPDAFKTAVVKPLLKKPNLDGNTVASYRLTESQYRRRTLDRGPRGESKGSGGVFQGIPAGSRFQHQGRGREKTKKASQCYRLNTSQSWEVAWVSIGLLQVNVGKGACEWEGMFLWRNTHRPKMVDNGCVFLHLGQGGMMSARGFKQRCAKTIDAHGTHTHTHRRTCLQCNVSL